ncbi:MAG: hypothetical protein ABIP94_20165 [Planctomycetota bacterium]
MSDRLPDDDWGDLDETLDMDTRHEARNQALGETAQDELPRAARLWFARQRYVHGLLRAMDLRASSAARNEAAIARVRRAATPPSWHWVIAAAAAILLIGIGLLQEGATRTPEAIVARAHMLLQQQSDHAFEVTIESTAPSAAVPERSLHVTMGAGGKFVLEGPIGFGPMRLADSRIGTDGTELWILGKMLRRAERRDGMSNLMTRINSGIDFDWLDLDSLFQHFVDSSRLRARPATGTLGERRICIEATKEADHKIPRIASVRILCDEATNRLVRFTIDELGNFGHHRVVTFDYVGPVEKDDSRYHRPW